MLDLGIESNMLARIGANMELALPCREVKFSVEMARHDGFDGVNDDSENIFTRDNNHLVEFGLWGAHISIKEPSDVIHQYDPTGTGLESTNLNRVLDTENQRLVITTLLPGAAENIVMYCYSQKNGQDCVVPVTVYDRHKNIWVKELSWDIFDKGMSENKLSTLILEIAGSDGSKANILCKTVIKDSDEFEVDDDDNVLDIHMRSIESLIAIGNVEIVTPRRIRPKG